MISYNVNVPVRRALWKDHKIIGYVTISMHDRDKLNRLQNEFYLGFTEIEHDLISSGKMEKLITSGFLSIE